MIRKRITLSLLAGVAHTALFAQNIPYVEYGRTEQKTEYVVPNSSGSSENIPSQRSTVKDTILILPNTISFHPLQMVDGTVALSYERANRKRNKALRLILGYSKLDQANYYSEKLQDFEQIYGEVNMKFFLTRKHKKAPVGLYASPFFQARQASYDFRYRTYARDNNNYVISYDSTVSNLQSFSLAGGIMLGYNVIVLEMISLEIYSGVGVQSVNGDYKINLDGEKKPLDTGFFYNNGPIFKLGASIGINF